MKMMPCPVGLPLSHFTLFLGTEIRVPSGMMPLPFVMMAVCVSRTGALSGSLPRGANGAAALGAALLLGEGEGPDAARCLLRSRSQSVRTSRLAGRARPNDTIAPCKRVRRGRHVRPRLAVFRPRCHSITGMKAATMVKRYHCGIWASYMNV
jgi:hypothetical protein